MTSDGGGTRLKDRSPCHTPGQRPPTAHVWLHTMRRVLERGRIKESIRNDSTSQASLSHRRSGESIDRSAMLPDRRSLWLDHGASIKDRTRVFSHVWPSLFFLATLMIYLLRNHAVVLRKPGNSLVSRT